MARHGYKDDPGWTHLTKLRLGFLPGLTLGVTTLHIAVCQNIFDVNTADRWAQLQTGMRPYAVYCGRAL